MRACACACARVCESVHDAACLAGIMPCTGRAERVLMERVWHLYCRLAGACCAGVALSNAFLLHLVCLVVRRCVCAACLRVRLCVAHVGAGLRAGVGAHARVRESCMIRFVWWALCRAPAWRQVSRWSAVGLDIAARRVCALACLRSRRARACSACVRGCVPVRVRVCACVCTRARVFVHDTVCLAGVMLCTGRATCPGGAWLGSILLRGGCVFACVLPCLRARCVCARMCACARVRA